MKKAADGPLHGILQYSEEPLVSIDFRGTSNSSIFDAAYTTVIGGNMVKVLSGTTTSGATRRESWT
jgi:glyceraldehyde-3-phosphate dehydrogenase/erythrose-4-phosphate dehydrogenase